MHLNYYGVSQFLAYTSCDDVYCLWNVVLSNVEAYLFCFWCVSANVRRLSLDLCASVNKLLLREGKR